MTYTITTPVKGQPVSSSLFGVAVKNAINDLDTRVAKLEGSQQLFIKRARRTTTSINITTTEIPVLRLDNVPVRAGQVYQIQTGEVNPDVDTIGTIATVRIRYFFQTTSGGLATVINSTQVGLYRVYQDDAGQSNVGNINTFYLPTADGFVSILMTVIRQGGSGIINMFATTGEPLDMYVQYGGADPGDTGVVLN